MNILRLFFLFFVGLFVRRLFTKQSRKATKGTEGTQSFRSTGHPPSTKKPESMRDITEQEIDDADFEEIP